MQLADRVGRKYDGQSVAARPPRIASLAAVTGVALPSRFQQPRLAFVRVYPYDRRPRILNIASNDAEYLLPTATVANQQFPSLYSMRHECYRSTGSQIIELWWSGGAAAQANNLTVSSGGAPPADGIPDSHVFFAEGTQHVFYHAAGVEALSEIIELWWRPGQRLALASRCAGWSVAGCPGGAPGDRW